MASDGVNKVEFVECLQPPGPSKIIHEFLRQYDRMMFAATCKVCLSSFTNFLENTPKEQQPTAKSFALRQFILRPNQENYYPLTYLNELKKINAKLYPAGSPEFIGKLRKALYEEDKGTLRILIDFGVDVTKINNDILRRNLYIEPDVFEIIVSSNKLDLTGDIYKGSPMILAAIFLDKFEFWHVLQNEKYKNKINWNYEDCDGRNLAYWSACCRTENIYKFLRVCHMKKVNMDKKDKLGNRPITVAVQHKKMDIIKYLVDECKIDLDATNKDGNTICHECCERGHPMILKYIIESGAKLDIINNEGKTALDFAKMYYFQPLIDILIEKNLWNKK